MLPKPIGARTENFNPRLHLILDILTCKLVS